ncbi:MAG: hypothetical protein AAGD05_04875 [Bacteroidota bacterium]
MDQEMMEVPLTNITQTGNVFQLIGPNAAVVDPNGLYNHNSPDFLFDRSQSHFEAVMCYYYIDQMMNYINNEIVLPGNPITPNAYSGGVRFDPHSGPENNAFYNRNNESLTFGDGTSGRVDLAEDATIIFHELTHGIHDWSTMGRSAFLQGISEGLADYWGASSTKLCENTGFWEEWEPEYGLTRHWGGLPIDPENERTI